ncbi:cytochrome c biogenesis protein CcdC [Solibacillus sp. FSL R7-0668]|uniref:CcdC family protein n=1 Tax=Solibacillus sp. FSL R7-0668 TaxID=2921688 RepID=UPI0030F9DD84
MFDSIPSHYLLIGTTILAAVMGTLALFVRLRAQKKPVSAKKILIPPIAMSSGALMFLFEEFRVAPLQILEAVSVGLIFSTILIATSRFEVREGAIYMKQSKAFPFILVGLLIFRIIMKMLFADSFDVGELAGMFFILAFAMLLPWRIGMLIKYKKLEKSHIVA